MKNRIQSKQIILPQPTLSGQQIVLMARASVQATAEKAKIPPLPAIGDLWHGGIYAGLSIDDGRPVALVLLPGDEQMKWKDACAWAEKQGGTLPSRIDQLVLLKNLKSEFKEEAYWSAEGRFADGAVAWAQYFSSGHQSGWHKGDSRRARAVRRVTVVSSGEDEMTASPPAFDNEGAK